MRMSLRNRRANSTQLTKEWNSVRGTNLNPSTIRRRLLQGGLRRCVAKKEPLISKLNKKKRLRFAREHVHWCGLASMRFRCDCGLRTCYISLAITSVECTCAVEYVSFTVAE